MHNPKLFGHWKRGMASIRRAAATFGAGYLKGILGKIFLGQTIKSF